MAIAAAVLRAATVEAQFTLGDFRIEGDIEAGVRAVLDPKQNERGKLEEYRDLHTGPFLHDLRLRIFRPDSAYSSELSGSKWGQEDQEFSLRTGRLGLWQLQFDWDQTRHVYSTTARTLATETARGVWQLPNPRPALPVHNAGRQIDEISQRWDTARLSFAFTPTPDLDLGATYTRINKHGERPMSLAFGSPGNFFYEVPGPIEHTIDDFRLTASLHRESWQLQFGYTMSLFRNSVRALVVDNPCFGATSGCADAGAPAGGALSLDPDNQAHTFSIAGGVNLPLRTRVNASLAYQVRYQNDTFLPHTIDHATARSPELILPQDSLHGFVQTFLGNFTLTTRPLPWPVTFTARYRIYDYIDESDEITFPGHVVNDRTLNGEARRAHRDPYTRQNADIDARWRIVMPLAVTIGTGWERWDRDENHREVPESDEFTGKLKVDWTPLDWLALGAVYRPSFRRIARYNTEAHLAHSVEEETGPFTAGQSKLLRKFDEGERDRQLVEASLTLSPFDTLSTTFTATWKFDDYIRSRLGLQKDRTWSVGMDFNWSPVERVSVYGGYVRESIKQRMRSRERSVVGGAVNDFPDFEWETDHSDQVDTIHLGVKATLVPKTLDWSFGASYSYALGRTDTNNPVTPASGTAAQNANAQAKPWPAIEDSLLRLETSLKYYFWKNWSATLGYAFEAFEKSDWRTDQINPFVPGTRAIFLGNDYRDYSAHILGMTVGYRFR